MEEEKVPTRSELMHYRLQAWMREHSCKDLEYLGLRPDVLGIEQHYYRIGDHEVSVEMIEELDMEEVDE